MNDSAISVKQLNLYVKSLIEGDKRLNYISVLGELSNFKNQYSSGHWYFTVKDNEASVRCVMFKSSVGRVGFLPEDGQKVIVSGRVSIYEKDGQYQFYADNMVPFGQGDLAAAFNLCKEKLQKEGLFDESTKRRVNRNPKRIAVVTSDTGAAVHDICSTLEKRLPSCEIILCPVTVQGQGAAKEMIKTLERVYSLTSVDTVIIGRGGGSAEDLAPFNDEALARKIYESPFPVISAVGHETDFTICDFVSDLRAATPTAAAVLASTDAVEIKNRVNSAKNRLISVMGLIYERKKYQLDSFVNLRVLKNPTEIIDRKTAEINSLNSRIIECTFGRIKNEQNELLKQIAKLDALSPLKTLGRGFSFVTKDEKSVTTVKDLSVGDNISVRFFDGCVKCSVKEKSNGKI